MSNHIFSFFTKSAKRCDFGFTGMLQGSDGLSAKPEDLPSDYLIHIDWDGILADEPGHEDDIVSRVRNILEVIWKDRAEAIEREVSEILDVRELRDYFRKPGNGGFWMDHVKRYSKSRRKAPIYRYLRSAKGNYGLWIYYHRLDKDILNKALLNNVEPKIRLEEDRLNMLRGRKKAAGSSGREAKQIKKTWIDRNSSSPNCATSPTNFTARQTFILIRTLTAAW